MQLPNGSQFAIATLEASAKTMSALTNATEAVGTLEASHNIAVNDLAVLRSGWAQVDYQVLRAKAVATNDVTWEDLNTLNTALFPTESGTGTAQEIASWTAFSGLLQAEQDGGEPEYWEYKFVDDPSGTKKRLRSGATAKGFKFQVEDDTSKPWYGIVVAAMSANTPLPMRITIPGGAKLYYNGLWFVDPSPTFVPDQGMVLRVTFDLVAPVTRYAS